MRGRFLLAELHGSVWALMPERLDGYRATLLRMAANEPISQELVSQIEADKGAREARRAAAGQASGGGIAVLPMYGVISQRMSMMDDLSGTGSMSTQRFSAALADALSDDTVESIIIDIDSPGGNVYGVAELAEEIYQARSQKPITAISNSLCASAAYWLGSQCNELYCTPGGEVGSIGVICAHADFSKQNEMLGVAVTYITAGKFKAEMNPDQPLSDEAKAYEQGRVDAYYSMFTKAVARGRSVPIGDVRDKMGQGRVLGAEDALAAKMIDGVATFDDVVNKVRTGSSQRKRAAETQMHRASLPERLHAMNQRILKSSTD